MLKLWLTFYIRSPQTLSKFSLYVRRQAEKAVQFTITAVCKNQQKLSSERNYVACQQEEGKQKEKIQLS